MVLGLGVMGIWKYFNSSRSDVMSSRSHSSVDLDQIQSSDSEVSTQRSSNSQSSDEIQQRSTISSSSCDGTISDFYIADRGQCMDCCREMKKGNEGMGDNNKNSQLLESAAEDELYVLRQLLFAFQGIGGKVFEKSEDGRSFNVCLQHPSLYQHAVHLAELGSLYMVVNQFVNSVPHGGAPLCLTALATAVSKCLHKVDYLVSQLETQLAGSQTKPTLIQFRAQTARAMLELQWLELVTCTCQSKNGGDLLSVLHQLSLHGDPKVQSWLQPLFTETSKVFYKFLEQWITADKFYDPYSEFFIMKNETVPTVKIFWAKDYYKLRSEMLPSFITMKQALQILEAGRIVALLKSIGYEQPHSLQHMEYAFNIATSEMCHAAWLRDGVMQNFIGEVLKEASSLLLQAVFNHGKLAIHLHTLSDYFLLRNGIFTRELLKKAETLLSEPAGKVLVHQLKARVESALQESKNGIAHEFDPQSYIKVNILKFHEESKCIGWDAFTLQYEVKKNDSVTLVLTSDALQKYHKLFRELLRAKRIHWLITDVMVTVKSLWRLLHSRKGILERDLHDVHLLASELSLLIQQVVYYIQHTKLESQWLKFESSLAKAQTLDDVIVAHSAFLDSALHAVFLDNAGKIVRPQLKLLYDLLLQLQYLCVQLTYCHVQNIQTDQESHIAKIIQLICNFQILKSSLQTWKKNFIRAVKQSPKQVQDLLVHLDCNDFYSTAFTNSGK